jgi:glyoxylase-like metal-dependent hydrolase (beta-lactamase superfamily II)
MKVFLKVAGLLLSIFVLFIVGVILFIFGGQQRPRSGPALGHSIEQVADGIATIFILDLGNGKLALVDAGNNPKGTPILEALQRRQKTPSDVQAIFITHAHPDHDAAVAIFPQAQVYAMQDEVNVAAGTEAYGSPLSKVFGAFNPHPFRVTHPLHDGEMIRLGLVNVTAYEVSGHTPGSAVYLAQGTLFTGDAFNITRHGKIEGPVWLFSQNAPQAVQSLKSLLLKISGRSSEIEWIATSHTGTLPGHQGLELLREFLSNSVD